jgi:hypothetical protein
MASEQLDYEERIARNGGLLTRAEQETLRRTRFVIAGCGSTGGAVISPLARSGARRFVLLDPGRYELNNLNRQDAYRRDLGRNKAEVQAERLRDIDPFCDVELHTEGARPERLPEIIRGDDLVIDAIDVTTDQGLQAKHTLHAVSCERRVPVVTAYDIATTQFIDLFDYRRVRRPFDGRVRAGRRGDDFLRALIPPTALPSRIFPVLLERRRDPELPFPQLAMTSTLLGALIVPYVLRVLAGRPVRRRLRIDLDELVRPQPAALLKRLRELAGLPALWLRMR